MTNNFEYSIPSLWDGKVKDSRRHLCSSVTISSSPLTWDQHSTSQLIITSCVKKMERRIPFYPLAPIFGFKGSNMGTNSIIVLYSPGAPLVVRLKVQVYKQNIIIRINHDFVSDRHQKLLGHDHHHSQHHHCHYICHESPPSPLQVVIFKSTHTSKC